MSFWDAYRDLAPWRFWLYVVLCLAGLALVLIDVFWKGAQYTTIAFLGVIIVAVLVRPRGWRGPRSQA